MIVSGTGLGSNKYSDDYQKKSRSTNNQRQARPKQVHYHQHHAHVGTTPGSIRSSLSEVHNLESSTCTADNNNLNASVVPVEEKSLSRQILFRLRDIIKRIRGGGNVSG